MVCCCVPFCGSNHKNAKELGVSFHEFPCDTSQRKQWIVNIHRKDFKISDKTSVCSLHFKPSDFNVGNKKRILKKGAVPTVFKGYPAYLQAAAAKHPWPPPKERLSYKTGHKKIGNPLNNTVQVATVDSVEVSLNEAKVDNTTGSNGTGLQTVPPTNGPPSSVTEITTLQSCSQPKQTVSCNSSKDTPPCVYRSTLGRIPMTPDALCRSRRVIQMQNYYLKKQVKSLRAQLEALKSKVKHQDDSASDTINADAKNGSERAIFLKDQLKAYSSKQARWSQATVRLCLMWQQESARGYEFARKGKFLCLPSRTTLKRWASAVISQPSVISIVEEKPMETQGCDLEL